ncbi:hypothetical protein PINS_up001343 [Pythium insidiosum]|nr:hypothetical protein PINS_up001343 [Pythium insidiosum]
MSPEEKEMADYLTRKFHTLQLFLLAGYGIMCLLSGLLICYLRHNRSVARKGDASAARKIILPAFEPLLWILGGATGVYTAYFATALAMRLYTTDISKLATEFFYSGRQFVLVTVVVFMFQKSVSIPALRRSVYIAFLLSTYTIPVVWYMVNQGNPDSFYTVVTTARALLLLLYAYIFVRPPCRASKRTIREYAVFAFVYYTLLFTYNEMFRQNRLELGFAMTYANLLWGAMCPLVIWRVLKADTEYWRGMGQRAVALQTLFRQKNDPDERISSRGLHVLIEMHRRFIIDFAYLEIKEKIGDGSSSIVFSGLLHSGIPVAVKVYSPPEFTEETVAEFSHEAALCGALHHPNIVRFHGMCVCPPTICLVSELCQGNLEDFLFVQDSSHKFPPTPHQFLLSLCYMLDAARAIGYLHSFSPAFIHRDIKPANFLVDADGTVKLTDFGESRSLPRPHMAQDLHPYMVIASEAHRHQIGQQSAGGPQGRSSQMLTIRGTVDYMAPEVIKGRSGQAQYGEAADVYSLAITFWDILFPGRDKYPTIKRGNHLQVFEAVIDGKRPIIEKGAHAGLRDVIESAWHPDPRLRPTAATIVSALERIQEEVMVEFAAQIHSTTLAVTTRERHGKLVSGAQIVDAMTAMGYVEDLSEAIRLGHALMDGGFLHHERHQRGFEGTDDSLYFFDEENIQLCQPVHPFNTELNGGSLRGMSTTMYSDSGSPPTGVKSRQTRVMTGSTVTDEDPLLEMRGQCACRQLGQRFWLPQSHKKRGRKKTQKALASIHGDSASSSLRSSLLQVDAVSGSSTPFESFDHIVVDITGPSVNDP